MANKQKGPDDLKGKPEPLFKPDVPAYAERMNILNHIRLQFHPVFKNAIGGPLTDGAREYHGIDIMCPFCKHIQHLGPPVTEQACEKCDWRWLYTAAAANCWLWVWKKQEVIDLDGKTSVILLPPSRKVDGEGLASVPAEEASSSQEWVSEVDFLGSRAVIPLPVGGAVELQRAFHPDKPRDPNRSNVSQSGYNVKEIKDDK